MLNFLNAHNTRSSNNNGSTESRKSQAKNKNMFVLGKLRGFGCKGMAMPVSAAVQSASVRQQAQTRRKRSPRRPINLADTPDICCAPPGISYLSDVVPMPNMNAQRTAQVQHSRIARRSANNNDISASGSLRIRSSDSRQSHHLYIRFTEGILEDEDQYRGWRLNLDSMSYEDLLDLGDKVGHVNRGLCEKAILHCLKIPKLSVAESAALLLSTDKDWRCCICQEGCRSDKEVGQLGCGHFHHISCIKQWLRQKNECPVCKIPPIPHKAKSSLY